MSNDSSSRKRRHISTDILISLAMCFMLFLFFPVQLYISNELDFVFDLYDVLHFMPLICLGAFVLSVILLSVSRCFGSRPHAFCLVAYTAVFFIFFIHGNFLVKDLPVMDGSTIDWSRYSSLRVISAAVTVAVAVIALVVFLRVKESVLLKAAEYVGGFGFAFLVLTLAISCFSHPTALQPRNTTCMTADGALEMSQDKNVVVFLLDALDATAFKNAIDSHPEYEEVFEDFTFFTNTMGVYPYTTRAVPYLLFGKLYDNSLYYPYYLREAIDESPFFEKLREEDFDQRVYFEYLYLTEIPNAVFKNFVNVEKFKEPVKFCKMLVKLTGFQVVPFELKRFCVLSPENIYFDTLKTNEGEEIDYYSFNNRDLYNRIRNTDISLTPQNCFRFFYSNGSHYPQSYDKDMNEIPDGTYEDGIECSVTLVKTYVEKLKEAGIYDNTVIVITADHGCNLADELLDEGKQNPALLIKGLKEDHPFRLNDAPVSHDDLQQAYLLLLDGASSDQVFEWKEGDVRERRYLLSDVLIESDITEYVSVGHAADTDALKPTGNVYHFDWLTAVPKDVRLSG